MERFGRSKTNSEIMLLKKYEEGLLSKAGQMSFLEKKKKKQHAGFQKVSMYSD